MYYLIQNVQFSLDDPRSCMPPVCRLYPVSYRDSTMEVSWVRVLPSVVVNELRRPVSRLVPVVVAVLTKVVSGVVIPLRALWIEAVSDVARVLTPATVDLATVFRVVLRLLARVVRVASAVFSWATSGAVRVVPAVAMSPSIVVAAVSRAVTIVPRLVLTVEAIDEAAPPAVPRAEEMAASAPVTAVLAVVTAASMAAMAAAAVCLSARSEGSLLSTGAETPKETMAMNGTMILEKYMMSVWWEGLGRET